MSENKTVYIVLFILFTLTLRSQDDFEWPLGKVSRNNVISNSNFKWLKRGVENYHLEQDVIDSIRPHINKEIEFHLVIGFWCRDSRVFIPKFIKFCDYLNSNNQLSINIYSVDRKKEKPKRYIRKYGIKYVPTLIVRRNNVEIGRIEEFLVESIEKDLFKILVAEDYTPFHAINWAEY